MRQSPIVLVTPDRCAQVGLMECNADMIRCYGEQSCRNSTILMADSCSLESNGYLANADSIKNNTCRKFNFNEWLFKWKK